MSVRTIKVSNVSLGASDRMVQEFFSFSGDIEYLEMKREDEQSQTAYVTFKEQQGAETAMLLTGATIVDKMVTISLDPDYQLPPAALASLTDQGRTGTAFQKAEDVVSSMLAKGFLLGRDAIDKATAFDEKHRLTSTASAKVASLDQKIKLTEKISMGTAAVNDKVKEVDQKFQVSEKTKLALAAAEQKVNDAGSALMKNRYVLTGATWVTGAFSKVTKAAGEVGQKTKEKVDVFEGERQQKVVNDFAQIHLSETESTESPRAVATDPVKAESPNLQASTEPSKQHLEAPSKHETEPEKVTIL